LGITLVVVLIWYNWANNYRYSSERIAGKILKKYTKPVADDQTALADDGKLSSDGKSASAVITVNDRQSSIRQEVLQLQVLDDCSPIDKTCISL
jgi:hypothetical protein